MKTKYYQDRHREKRDASLHARKNVPILDAWAKDCARLRDDDLLTIYGRVCRVAGEYSELAEKLRAVILGRMIK